jgi:hypothetical protein
VCRHAHHTPHRHTYIHTHDTHRHMERLEDQESIERQYMLLTKLEQSFVMQNLRECAYDVGTLSARLQAHPLAVARIVREALCQGNEKALSEHDSVSCPPQKGLLSSPRAVAGALQYSSEEDVLSEHSTSTCDWREDADSVCNPGEQIIRKGTPPGLRQFPVAPPFVDAPAARVQMQLGGGEITTVLGRKLYPLSQSRRFVVPVSTMESSATWEGAHAVRS